VHVVARLSWCSARAWWCRGRALGQRGERAVGDVAARWRSSVWAVGRVVRGRRAVRVTANVIGASKVTRNADSEANDGSVSFGGDLFTTRRHGPWLRGRTARPGRRRTTRDALRRRQRLTPLAARPTLARSRTPARDARRDAPPKAVALQRLSRDRSAEGAVRVGSCTTVVHEVTRNADSEANDGTSLDARWGRRARASELAPSSREPPGEGQPSSCENAQRVSSTSRPADRQASSFMRIAWGDRNPAGMILVPRRSRSEPA
jgi:hypothetical protein